MNPRDFDKDLEQSNCDIVRQNWELIFQKKFGSDVKIVWKDDYETQTGFGTDVTLQTKNGRRYSIELKTRNINTYKTPYIMEIVHQIYTDETRTTHLRKKEGWVYCSTAEYIFHATIDDNFNIIECIFYSLMPFKTEKWKSNFDKYNNLWLSTQYQNGNFQLTLNKLIPKIDIRDNAMEYWDWEK